MKTLFNLTLGLFLLVFTATCSSTSEKTITVTGTVEEQGITSYQYGTHTISGDGKFYALKSETIDLDQYIGETVTIKGEKIAGYPVDGGPEYLMVLEIE